MRRRLKGRIADVKAIGSLVRGVDRGDDTRKLARGLACQAPKPLWAAPTEGRSADLIAFLRGNGLLVGEVLGGGAFGKAAYGPVRLLDGDTGEERWSASRERDISVVHLLLVQQPLLVFLTAAPDEGRLWALDSATGGRAWDLELGAGATSVTACTSLISLSGRDDDQALEAIEASTGRRLWRQRVAGTDLDITLLGGTVLISGSAVHAFDAAGGRPRFSTTLPNLGDGVRRVVTRADGVWAWSDHGVAGLGDDGRVLWTQLGSGRHQAVVAAGETLIRLERHPEPLATDTLEALDARDGTVRWRADAGGIVVSPITVHRGQVVFTTEDAVVALEAASGRAGFRTEFPMGYALGNPVSAPIAGVPDLVALNGDVLVVDRETAGLRAFRLPGGEATWAAPPQPGAMTIAQSYGEVLAGANILEESPRVPANPLWYMVDWSGVRRNVLGEQTQARHDQVMRDTARHLDDQASSAADRQAALAARRVEAAMEVHRAETEVATERVVAGAEMAFAVGHAAVTIGQTFSKVFDQSMRLSLADRAHVNWRWSLRSRGSAFRDGIHLTGFSDGNVSGVRIVHLDDGRIEKLHYEPHDPLQMATRVPTGVFGLAPDGDRLILVGLGLDETRYEPVGERSGMFKVKGFKASILCYELPLPTTDTGSVDFGSAPGAASSYYNLKDACMVGHTPSIKRLLAGGADPNQVVSISPPDAEPQILSTPLRLAAVAYPEAIAVLLAAGAKPTHELTGDTAMDMASEDRDEWFKSIPQYQERRARVRELLGAAGAERRSTTIGGEGNSGAPQPVEVGSHLFLIRRAVGEGDDWRGGPLLSQVIAGGHPDVARALLDRGADANATDPAVANRTALHAACGRRQVDLVRALLERGADPNAGRDGGATPLAMTLNPFEQPTAELRQIVELLLEAGADPNVPLFEYYATAGVASTLLESADRIGGGLSDLLRTHGART